MLESEKPLVLVVEDEELLLKAIVRKLQENGFSVLSAVSGKQALDLLQSTDTTPHAIWLDYYLNDMNGLEFMETVKKNPRHANIPVIVVSNSASPAKVNSMLALGVKKYVLKAEHRLDDIIGTLREVITASKIDA